METRLTGRSRPTRTYRAGSLAEQLVPLIAAFFSAGGPQITVFAYHDPGNVPVYSWSFLIASLLGFAVHLPLLDRAEKKRKAILTGGTAAPWYGPA